MGMLSKAWRSATVPLSEAQTVSPREGRSHEVLRGAPVVAGSHRQGRQLPRIEQLRGLLDEGR